APIDARQRPPDHARHDTEAEQRQAPHPVHRGHFRPAPGQGVSRQGKIEPLPQRLECHQRHRHAGVIQRQGGQLGVLAPVAGETLANLREMHSLIDERDRQAKAHQPQGNAPARPQCEQHKPHLQGPAMSGARVSHALIE
ncbi:hypothetical protein CWB90_23765, partial [Pseudoalteromonas piscicida]